MNDINAQIKKEELEKEVMNGVTAADMLKNARLTGRGKRSISTISKVLRIREEYLEALEAGNYALISELVYILGFARNYAMELGLNPEVVIEKIKNELGVNTNAEDDMDLDLINDSEKESVKEDSLVNKLKKHKLIVIGGIVALVVIIVAVFAFGGGEKQVTENRNALVVNPVEIVTTPKHEITYNLPIAKEYGIENREDANVVIQADKESWVKIVNGSGDNLFSLVLLPGDIYYVPVGDKISATIGNAGGIDVWVNGKLVPKLGKLNVRISDVLMTPEGLLK